MPLHTRTNNNVLTKDIAILIKPNEFQILEIKRDFSLDNIHRIREAKQIASQLLNADFVDGIDMTDGDKYLAGIYCDDLAVIKYDYHLTVDGNKLHGPAVIINELWGIAPEDVPEITSWWNLHTEKEAQDE